MYDVIPTIEYVTSFCLEIIRNIMTYYTASSYFCKEKRNTVTTHIFLIFNIYFFVLYHNTVWS
jgi:hypothetical protein